MSIIDNRTDHVPTFNWRKFCGRARNGDRSSLLPRTGPVPVSLLSPFLCPFLCVRRTHALDRFAEVAPDAEEIEVKVSDHIEFFDCGANFERIVCPSCGTEIPDEWWQDRLNDDSAHNGFKLAKYSTPCCNIGHTLHDLIYEWPQGFGHFAIDAMNPNIGKLDDKFKKEFEEILGTPLRVIYQHI